MTALSATELHRPFDIIALPEGGRVIDITAGEGERQAIAARLGLLAIHAFSVHGRLDPVRRGHSAVFSGRLAATVVQECIVTGEPVDASIDEEFSVRLQTESEAEARDELEIAADEDDVEVAEGGMVDLGDIAVQYLALSLDPYPRLPGAEAPALPKDDGEEESIPSNPFAVLKKLKDKT
jgi:uncharacterized metal-binding protein YceD (DUF177 family)